MLYFYSIFHLNLNYSSIENDQQEKVVNHCYWPLPKLARKLGIPLGIEASAYTIETIAELDREWIEELGGLTEKGLCEFIGSGYAQIIGSLVPAEVNAANLRFGHETYERLRGFRPEIALVNEQAYSAGLVKHYLDAGYRAIIMEWDNPFRYHPEWKPEWRYYPQYALGAGYEAIPVIWNSRLPSRSFNAMSMETWSYRNTWNIFTLMSGRPGGPSPSMETMLK